MPISGFKIEGPARTMRVRVSYTIEADNDLRRAINMRYGRSGLASRAEVQQWYERHGTAADDDLMQEFHDHEEEQ